MKDKDKYINDLKAKIEEWNADIHKLKAKANQMEANTKLEYQKQIQSLKNKRDEMKEKLSHTDSSSEEAWKDLKSGLDQAWETMNNAVKSAKSRFK